MLINKEKLINLPFVFRLLLIAVLFLYRIFFFFFGWGKIGHFSNLVFFRKIKIIEKEAKKLFSPIEITSLVRDDHFEIYAFKVLGKKVNENKARKKIAKALEINEGKIFFRKIQEKTRLFELLISKD